MFNYEFNYEKDNFRGLQQHENSTRLFHNRSYRSLIHQDPYSETCHKLANFDPNFSVAKFAPFTEIFLRISLHRENFDFQMEEVLKDPLLSHWICAVASYHMFSNAGPEQRKTYIIPFS
jgi:hypothetical protein